MSRQMPWLAVTAAVVAVTACGPQPNPNETDTWLADGSDRAVTEVIDSVTTFPTELDPRIWDGMQMKPDVRETTTRVVDRIVDDTGIDGLTIDGVDLFGSNASYEYDDASDFGVHVFVSSASMTPDDLRAVLRLLNDDVERRQEGHITFYGVPVEVTFHSERGPNYQPRPGIGQYSISEGRWTVPPVQQPDRFDRAQMAVAIKGFITEYNDLVSSYRSAPTGFDCSQFAALDDRLSAYRDTGFTGGPGSRSTQNLSYRALRRLNVSIPDMVDELQDDCTFVNESLGVGGR
ncbi:hypothetical protein [Mycolicibacterium vanbaalenii]|uniref:Lipoprotein n=1 Tax=Mycolicibacterium vanbaalenii (strain DSM 7251 / JCM 13017 / BCRC 16820 / KCTC 9966 / NRRL B-24157 / PYR-1) TaxID=350058 RepID=A1TAB6_MYCVP|nr:hypothetical protein [Mycolicibacterium vanbaalenii]ABM14116.1 hypothetical protein Mvan_3318 [Mycolicibacterium vanbaalenii PYR-1]MCV7126425.1 hypothetical protein [Mycolicibacterium vanbaalenii PYR-1]